MKKTPNTRFRKRLTEPVWPCRPSGPQAPFRHWFYYLNHGSILKATRMQSSFKSSHQPQQITICSRRPSLLPHWLNASLVVMVCSGGESGWLRSPSMRFRDLMAEGRSHCLLGHRNQGSKHDISLLHQCLFIFQVMTCSRK